MLLLSAIMIYLKMMDRNIIQDILQFIGYFSGNEKKNATSNLPPSYN